MSNVVPFVQKSQFSGEAFCLACNHEWVSVGEYPPPEFLDCPGCKVNKGRLKYAYAPPHPYWECSCGNALFYMTEQGHFCPNCGIYNAYD